MLQICDLNFVGFLKLELLYQKSLFTKNKKLND